MYQSLIRASYKSGSCSLVLHFIAIKENLISMQYQKYSVHRIKIQIKNLKTKSELFLPGYCLMKPVELPKYCQERDGSRL